MAIFLEQVVVRDPFSLSLSIHCETVLATRNEAMYGNIEKSPFCKTYMNINYQKTLINYLSVNNKNSFFSGFPFRDSYSVDFFPFFVITEYTYLYHTFLMIGLNLSLNLNNVWCNVQNNNMIIRKNAVMLHSNTVSNNKRVRRNYFLHHSYETF